LLGLNPLWTLCLSRRHRLLAVLGLLGHLRRLLWRCTSLLLGLGLVLCRLESRRLELLLAAACARFTGKQIFLGPEPLLTEGTRPGDALLRQCGCVLCGVPDGVEIRVERLAREFVPLIAEHGAGFHAADEQFCGVALERDRLSHRQLDGLLYRFLSLIDRVLLQFDSFAD
jgi:hypothetical protein